MDVQNNSLTSNLEWYLGMSSEQEYKDEDSTSSTLRIVFLFYGRDPSDRFSRPGYNQNWPLF